MGAIYLWYDEYIYLDFTHPYLNSIITVLVPKPHQLPEWMIPVNTFRPSIWIAVIISLAVIVISLYFVNKYTDIIVPKELKVKSFSSWSGVTLQAIGMALLQPPGTRLPFGSPLRRFFTLSEVFFLLFTTIYSAALASILTVPAYYPAIDDGRQLYESGIHWVSSHDAWVYSIRNASEPYLRGLVDRFEAHDTETLKKLAKKDGYAFPIEIMTGGHVTQQEHLSEEMISGLHVMKHELYGSPSVMILRKGSPYTEYFTSLIHRCIDGGLLLYWESYVTVKYLSTRLQTALQLSKSSAHELTEPVKLKLDHVQGAFIVLFLGTIIALIVFIIEKYSNKLNKNHRLSRQQFLN
ncbi:hypothetical protein O3M35_000571 [Rhynocoris fuscipes]|uniref:Ionotropic glutamate receptor C-terminal domain-containing protein n=1 Tax=Rhynocoris fuscipes TaxID=488301 RepID=A0AAW1DN78_9HEMI